MRGEDHVTDVMGATHAGRCGHTMENRRVSPVSAIIVIVFGIGGAAASLTGFILLIARQATPLGLGLLILGMLLMGMVVFRIPKVLATSYETPAQGSQAKLDER